MQDKIEGYVEVGTDGSGNVVLNHPQMETDEHGVGHIIFSPRQARDFAHILLKQTAVAEDERRMLQLAAERKSPEDVPPVDRSARQLLDGSPVDDAHREINPATGMQNNYVVLTEDERQKGFIRPVRRTYVHVGIEPKMNGIVLVKVGERGCGTRTTMGIAIAETYARDPGFYSGTFCCTCAVHRPLNEFYWEGTTEIVGS